MLPRVTIDPATKTWLNPYSWRQNAYQNLCGIQAGASDVYTSLYVFNPYEAQRFINTVLKYAPSNPRLWQNNDPSTGIPNFTINLKWDSSVPPCAWAIEFPFRDSTVERRVSHLVSGQAINFFVRDLYINGLFQQTEFHKTL